MTSKSDRPDGDYIHLNLQHWENISRKYKNSQYYLKDRVINGGSSLSEIEKLELGDIKSMSGIHLQCGIGIDTISLARSGASMLGIDFSETAIRTAQSLAVASNVTCSFSVSNVMDRRTLPAKRFDFAYASHGVFRWIPNIKTWASNTATLIKPGGFLYIFEIHPALYRLRYLKGGEARLTGDYFDETGKIRQLKNTHLGPLDDDDARTVAHFDWRLATIVNAIIGSGLQLLHFEEHRASCYDRLGLFPNRNGSLWYSEESFSPIPCSYSLRAQKPL